MLYVCKHINTYIKMKAMCFLGFYLAFYLAFVRF